jgi:hypothetical protein
MVFSLAGRLAGSTYGVSEGNSMREGDPEK